MVRMDKLLDAWRADPGVVPTVELCAMLTRASVKPGARDAIPTSFVLAFGTEALLKHPKAPEVHIAIATLYHAAGELRQAARILEVAKKSAPRDARVLDLVSKLKGARSTKELVSDAAQGVPGVPRQAVSPSLAPARATEPPPSNEMKLPLDAETFDAPTTPLDPPTDQSGPPTRTAVSGPPKRMERKPTLQGAAPPPTPSQDTDASWDGPPTTTGVAPIEATEAQAHPRRTRTLLGSGDENVPGGFSLRAKPETDDQPTSTRVGPEPSDEPRTRSVSVSEDVRTRSVPPKEERPAPVADPERSDPRTSTRVAPPPSALLQSTSLQKPRPQPVQSVQPPPPKETGEPQTSPRVELTREASQPLPARAAQPPPAPEVRRPAARRGVGTEDPLMKAALARRARWRGAPQAEQTNADQADDEDEHDVPTRVGDRDNLVATTAPRLVPPLPARAAPRPPVPGPRASSDETSLSEADFEVQDDLRTAARGALEPLPEMARPAGFGGAATAGPGRPFEHSMANEYSGPSTFSKALTNVWPDQGKSGPPPGGNVMTDVPPESTGDDSVDTRLRHLAPLHPSVRPQPPPSAPPAQPVLPQVEVPDDDEPGTALRTYVMRPHEAYAASQVDPRAPQSVRAFDELRAAPVFGPGPSNAGAEEQPSYAPSSVDLGYASIPVPPAPAFGPPPTFGPPPVVARGVPLSAPPPDFGTPSPFMFDMPPDGMSPAPEPPLPQGRSFPPGPAANAPSGSMAPGPAIGSMSAPFVPSMPPVYTAPPELQFKVVAEARRPALLYIGLGVATVVVALIGTYAAYLYFVDKSHRDDAGGGSLADAEHSLLSGTPQDLAKADAILSTVSKAPPKDLAIARLHAKILRSLDVSGKDEGIGPAIDAARAAGVDAASLGAGELSLALALSDDAKIDKLLSGETEAARGDPFYELAAGVALEKRGDPHAIDRYDHAVSEEARLASPKIRAVRAALLADDVKGADARIVGVADSPSKTALLALEWVVKRADGTPDPPGRPATLPTTAEVLRPLVLTYAATALLDAEKGGDPSTLSKRGIDEADGPATAVLFGRLAEARGDPSSAVDAAKRALAIGPRYTPAVRQLCRATLQLGKLDVLKDAIAGLPEDVTNEARSILAYERSDITELEAILAKLDANSLERPGVVARRDRLAGDQPLSSDVLAKLAQAEIPGADLLAVDALLDQGNLVKARELTKKWPDPSAHPLRSRRYARLLRYEGNLDEAALAIRSAAPGEAKRVEEVLIQAEVPALRALAKQSMHDKPSDMSPDLARMLEAYVAARDEEKREAEDLLRGVEVPGKGVALPTRIVAALAFSEAEVKRGQGLSKALGTVFPENPDVKRATAALEPPKGKSP